MLELLGLSLILLQKLAVAAPSADAPVFFPVYWAFEGYPRIASDIKWGTPQQAAVPTIVDLGSANYWVYQAGATVNYGSRYLFTQGPCNITAHPAFNNTASKSASKLVYTTTEYSYGGNGKIILAPYQVNDTMHWANSKVPAMMNQRVALSNFTIIRQAVDNASACYKDTFAYDHSILGLSQPINPAYATVGPSFRGNLLANGAIQSGSMSMWMDKQPAAYKGKFHGSVLFGAVATSKYSGPLVQVKLNPPSGSYVGYYLSTPISITANNIEKPHKSTILKPATAATNCLIDSGTGQDSLPIDNTAFNKATGLFLLNGAIVAYNGTCASMPNTAALNLTFAGAAAGRNVTISMPLRNYIRDQGTLYNSKYCVLSLDVDTSDSCILGAPFATALFLAVNDDKNEIGIAQGGVSSGAQTGTSGLGTVKTIGKGQSLPFTY